MGDKALRQAFKALVQKLVQRRELTTTEGQEVLDVLNTANVRIEQEQVQAESESEHLDDDIT